MIPSIIGDPPDRPQVMTALLPDVAVHPEILEWLDEAEQCIVWAFLQGLRPMAAATASYGASCVCVEERLGRGAGMAVEVAQDSVRPA